MSLPFGVIYLSGARTKKLDDTARFNMENANTVEDAWPIGILVQPLTEHYLLGDIQNTYRYVGIDNGCFTPIGQARFDMSNYLRMIDKALKKFGDDLLFATAQDVAFDWEGTLKKSLPTLGRIRRAGAPAALVLQDGATPENIPWSEIDAVFVGGSTEWKLSPFAHKCCQAAIKRKKWVHMGRVNSLTRIRVAQSFGCKSVDGTYLLHETKKGKAEEAVDEMVGWGRATYKADSQRKLWKFSGR